MDLNKKYVIVGLTLLLMIWVGNIFYYNKHVLKEPVFLKHYYDIKEGMNSFNLYYIQNINSGESVTSIIFPELSPEPIITNEYYSNSDYRYYKMKNISVVVNFGDSTSIPSEYKNKLITKAEVHFSNGKVMNVNIGKIYLYNGESGNKVLYAQETTSSNNNTGSTRFSVDKDIKVSGIYCRFAEIVGKAIQVNLNGVPLNQIKFPMKLSKGDTLEVSYSYKFSKGDIGRNYEYNFPIDIKIEDLNGIKEYGSCFTNYFIQSPEQVNIDAIVKDQRR